LREDRRLVRPVAVALSSNGAIVAGRYLIRRVTPMTNQHAANYRLAEEKFNQRVEELCQSPDLSTLRQEIGVLRALVEETLQSTAPERRNLPIIRDLVKAIGQLVTAHRVAELEADRLLEKETVFAIGQALVEIIVSELDGKFVGWEETCDSISDRMMGAISIASNTRKRRREPIH
jgi:hypothetical protein